jgi:transcriptional regulator with XRE-family HTH domain
MRRGRKPRGDKGPNHVLRQEREMRGWSQSRLAELIGANPNMISRWECGERGVDYIYQEKLCQLFEKNAIELGFMKEPETQEKALSEISATNLIVSATFESETEDKLDYAENLINLAWAAWFASRPKEAAHSVNRLLSNLEKTAYSLYQPGHTSRAKKLTIRAHGLLGTICLDAMQNETALFHYMQAHRFAEEIHDVNLSATYLCLIGDVLRRQNDQSGALKYMENARNSASNASKTTKAIYSTYSHIPMETLDRRQHLSVQFQKQLIFSHSLEKELTRHKKNLSHLKFMRFGGK